MKKILVFALALFLVSCGGNKNPETPEEIREQIAEYKKEVEELNSKISDLQKELTQDTTGNGFRIPVSVKQLQPDTFRHFIEVNGSVEAVNAAYISSEINGQIRKIYVDEGDRVSAGDLLVKLNTNVIESSIEEVETSLELAETIYKRQKQLWEKNIGSEVEYLSAKNNKESLEQRLETLKAQLDMAEVKSPINGVVDEIYKNQGEIAIPGVQIMEVLNLENLYINADVSEAYITSVKKGEMVLLQFPSLTGMEMWVPVHRVGNVIKAANRTFTLQLKIKNRNSMIKPNMIAVVKINDYTSTQALTVPAIIIKQDLQGKYVYVARKKDNRTVAIKKYVNAGKSYEDETEITEGLQAGDRVIVKGYTQVSDGAPLEIRKSK